jgi:hypothetical protein
MGCFQSISLRLYNYAIFNLGKLRSCINTINQTHLVVGQIDQGRVAGQSLATKSNQLHPLPKLDLQVVLLHLGTRRLQRRQRLRQYQIPAMITDPDIQLIPRLIKLHLILRNPRQI